MRKIFYVLLSVSIIVSCKNNKKEATIIADNFVKEKYLSLFTKARITDVGNDRASFVKGDVLKKMNIMNVAESSLLDSKQFYEHNYFYSQTQGEFRNELIKNALESSDIKALESAEIDKGFFSVNVSIEYGGDSIRSHPTFFNIILSNNLEVINNPNIDSIVKNTDSIINSLK